MTPSASGLIVLSCGGYRTGSTLQYNLIGEYAERANAVRRIGFVEPGQAALLGEVWSFVEALGVAVAKCHLAPAPTSAAPPGGCCGGTGGSCR